MNKNCCIIAEAGVNHNGSLDLAFALIDQALTAGADFIKFQTFQADQLATKAAPQAAYQMRNTGSHESQYDMLKRLELPLESFKELSDYCKQKPIQFLSTPFDIASAYFLAKLGMPMMKVSSGDLTNMPFLRELGSIGLPVILSTGMATLGDVEAGVNVLEKTGLSMDQITILHCTTEYPAPIEEVNLKAMDTLRFAFPGATIGYSDHTEGIAISLAAAAMGAELLEKHFTLDRTMSGPDHKASIELSALSELTQGVRAICSALGNGRKVPSASEIKNMAIARKSIVAACPIKKGDIFSSDNLTVRRPGSGSSPMLWDEFIGTTATRDYAPFDLIVR